MSRRGFTRLEHVTMDPWLEELSGAEYKVATYMLSLAWKGGPAKSSVSTTARRCGLSKSSAYRATSSLTVRGILKPIRVGAGRGESWYEVNVSPELAFHQGNSAAFQEWNANVPPAERYCSTSGTLQPRLRNKKDSKKEGDPALPESAIAFFSPEDEKLADCWRCKAPLSHRECADETVTELTARGYCHVFCLAPAAP